MLALELSSIFMIPLNYIVNIDPTKSNDNEK